MYFVNRFACEGCNNLFQYKQTFIMKEAYCERCGHQLIYCRSDEFNDDGMQVRSHHIDGKVVEIKPKYQSQTKPAMTSTKPIITCPYCQSTNCKKLTAISRGASFGLVGFGSGKIGKQWHCNNCKSDF